MRLFSMLLVLGLSGTDVHAYTLGIDLRGVFCNRKEEADHIARYVREGRMHQATMMLAIHRGRSKVHRWTRPAPVWCQVDQYIVTSDKLIPLLKRRGAVNQIQILGVAHPVFYVGGTESVMSNVDADKVPDLWKTQKK